MQEAEEAGTRGDVEQAQGLMKLCDRLKEEKDSLIKQQENRCVCRKYSGAHKVKLIKLKSSYQPLNNNNDGLISARPVFRS